MDVECCRFRKRFWDQPVSASDPSENSLPVLFANLFRAR